MAEAVLKPQYSAKTEQRQRQRIRGTAAVRASDAGAVGCAKGPGTAPDPPHFGKNAASLR